MNSASAQRNAIQPLRLRMRESARSAILDAAEQVMAVQGLRAARMEDIAARVGVSVGTLYNYFVDRQQMVRALLDLRQRELLAGLDGALEGSEGMPYRARLEGLLRSLLEHASAHVQLFGALLEDGMSHGAGDRSLNDHQHVSREVARRIEDLNRDGVRQGALRPEDAAHYPALMLGMVQSIVLGQVLSRQHSPTGATVEVLLRCFLDGAAPRPGALAPAPLRSPRRRAARQR
jgi:AcrR family transcriptional regulator